MPRGLDADLVIPWGQRREAERAASVGVAKQRREQGLEAAGDNYFIETPNSGTRSVSIGMANGAGEVVSGALEDSNVETVMLAFTAVLSGVLAALAVMPRIMVGGEKAERPNLLCFGSIATIDTEDYIARMREVLADDAWEAPQLAPDDDPPAEESEGEAPDAEPVETKAEESADS